MTSAQAGAVLVVAPLREEVGALRGRLHGGRRLGRAAPRMHRGRLGGEEVIVAVVGDGARRAVAGLDACLAAAGPAVRAVLVVGVAGGLDAGLGAGAVFAPEVVRTPAGAARALDPVWRESLPPALRLPGALVSVPAVLAGAAAKRALGRDLGPGALAVDLESFALAGVAAQRDLPFLVVRAVSDTVDESLPAFLARCLGADGSVRRARVVAALLRKPRRARALRAVAARMRACAEALADAAEVVVARAPRRAP